MPYDALRIDIGFPAGGVDVCDELRVGLGDGDAANHITSVTHTSCVDPPVAPANPSHAVLSPVEGAALSAPGRPIADENDADCAPRVSVHDKRPDDAFIGVYAAETAHTSPAAI